MRNARTLVESTVTALVVAFLVGCGGGGESSPAGDGTISGRIADGYLRGAVVFWDCNNNFRLDVGEPSAISKEGGRYEIDRQPSVSCHLSADVPSSAIDEDTGERVSAGMFMRAHPNNATFISPLTTLVALNVVTEAQLKARFGVNNTLNVSDDYIAAGAEGVAHHNVARYVAVGLQSLSIYTFEEGSSGLSDRLNGVLQLIPAGAFSSNQPLPATTFESFARGLVQESDEIKISSGYMRFEVDEAMYRPLDTIQKGHVDRALEIYRANADLIGQGEVLNWSNLPLDLRQELKGRFVSSDFDDSDAVIQLIAERNEFLRLQRSEINNALTNFQFELAAVLIDGSLDVSVTYFDGWISVLAPSVVKRAGAGLLHPQKSIRVKRLLSSLGSLQSGLGCVSNSLRLIQTISANLDRNQYLDFAEVWTLAECIINDIKSDEKKLFLKTITAAIKQKKLIEIADRQKIEVLIAHTELLMALIDILGVDQVPGASQGLGALKVVLALAKSAKLYADMGNTNDAAQLAFEKALSDIGSRVDAYLERYAVEAFDLRINRYFRYIPPYTVSVSDGVAEPLVTSVNASLSLAPYVSFTPRVQWFFGDGNTSMGRSVSHIYSRPGSYTLTAYAQADTELAVKVYETTVDVSCAANQLFSSAEGCIDPVPVAPVVSSVLPSSPTIAIAGLETIFTITGSNLPTTANFSITFNGCANVQFLSRSGAAHTFSCTPQLTGPITVEIRRTPDGAILRSETILVSSSGSQVPGTWAGWDLSIRRFTAESISQTNEFIRPASGNGLRFRMTQPVDGDDLRFSARIKNDPVFDPSNCRDMRFGFDNSFSSGARDVDGTESPTRQIGFILRDGVCSDAFVYINSPLTRVQYLGDTSSWHVYTINIKNGVVSLFYDGVLVFRTPYVGAIGMLDALIVGGLYNAQIDPSSISLGAGQ